MSNLLVVSGASRGLGRAIAIAFANSTALHSNEPLHAVLLGRNMDGLDETALSMTRAGPSELQTTKQLDLGNHASLEATVGHTLRRHVVQVQTP